MVFLLISFLGLLFIVITYISATYFYNASTELLNKDVAAHIAKFTSPFEEGGINKRKADSVFYSAMVVSPSIEVYFLDNTGKVIYYEAPDTAIKLWHIPLENIDNLIAAKGETYVTSPDPKYPDQYKIFSASEVYHDSKKIGYIYVILGSKEYNNINELLFKSHAGTLALQAFFIVVLLSVLLSFFYIKRLQRKYDAVLQVLEKYRQGYFETRFITQSQDEFAPITGSFNKMAELLSHNIEQLKKVELERKTFIANISHDLRTPLAIASGYAETIIGNYDKKVALPEQKNYMQLVLNKLKQVEIMVLQLFELSQMDSVDFEPKKEPFVLAEILQEITAGFQITATNKNISLKCNTGNDLQWIDADVKMVERIVQNLTENAIKNTPDNGIITIVLTHENNNLKVVFENTGEPMPAALVSWINDDSDTTNLQSRPTGRKGLGLAIVKRILKLHNASLFTGIKEGTTNYFVFYLPVWQG